MGCIYTAQGFDFDYIGVIVGNDLKYNASADSLAVNFVVAPISLAFSVSFIKSEPVAPLIAFTCDIAASKSR